MWEYCAENAEWFAGVAYNTAMVLFAISYAVRDILWLRVLAVVAGILGIPFFCFGEPVWLAVFWNSLFVTINIVRLGMLVHERRPVQLSDVERRLHMLVFRALMPREFVRLLEIAEWRDEHAGTRLVVKGEPLDGLIVLYSGIVGVQNNGVEFAESRDGQCIGEMSFVTGMPPSATVIAKTPVRCVYFPKPALDDLMKQDDRIREVMHSVLGFDMAEKLAARSQIDTPRRQLEDATD